jgi:hypothetical protein
VSGTPYTRFSFSIPLATPEEREWLEKHLKHPKPGWYTNPDDWHETDPLIPLQYEINEDEAWLYSQEQADVVFVARMLKDFLDFGHSQEHFSFGYATGSTKMEEDVFGGGAVVIFPYAIRYLHTDDWLEAQLS